MEIDYSDHSKERIKERNIQKRLIKKSLTDFDSIKSIGSNKYISKKSLKNNKVINVVFVKKKEYYKIITAYYEN